MADLDALHRSIVDGDASTVIALTDAAIAEGVNAHDILAQGLVPGIQEVGEMFENGECFLPELLASGQAMTEALALIEPMLSSGEIPRIGKVLLGTVADDVHDIGKNIVAMILRGNGWEVTDLGVDVQTDEFVEAVRTGDYDILGLSSLLTMTQPSVVEVLETLEAEGLRDKVKVMVGGAPVTQKWADRIGADAYAADAPEAARKAARLVAKS